MDKVAIVTGGVRGIGKAISIELLKEGYIVHVTYSSDDDAAKDLSTQFKNVFVHKSNVSEYSNAKDLVKEIVEKHSRVDVLVNNAGITRDKKIFFMDEKSWQDVINTNLSGTFYMTRLVGQVMLKQQMGNIVNISSISANICIEGQSNYSASKAGIQSLTKSAAKEFASYNIRVNSVSPGFINTKMIEKIDERIITNIALKRFGEPIEVANAVMFLISDKALYITGQNIIVDGGLSL